jgi:hypothetical protein
MSTRTTLTAAALLAAGVLLGGRTIPAVAQGKQPSPFTPAQLAERTLHRRAVETVIWGMPAVNFERMLQAAIDNGAVPNQVVYWSRPVNWKDQTLTPNPDTIYFNPFYDTTSGPVVLEIPPAAGDASITGSIDMAWQNAMEDVGPAGVDKGQGGKYLITPPGYKTPAGGHAGYIALPSDTFRGFAILRSNFKSGSDADIAAAVDYGKRIKLYPLGRSDTTKFVDVYDKLFDATIPYDARFFELLDRFMQAEPWLTRDKVMIDMLKSIGIEKGKSFKPDERTKTILASAASEAHAYLDDMYAHRYFPPPYYAGGRWAVPASAEVLEQMATNFAKADRYSVDSRAVAYSVAYFSPKRFGAGQAYLMTIVDKAGLPLSGKQNYQLHVPPNAPVTLYWSATAYDRETHALIRETSRSSRGSNSDGIQKNSDGSMDVYFGPAAPAGKESNWIPTNGRDFEVLFRFYGPEKPLFDKTWVLPDIETDR